MLESGRRWKDQDIPRTQWNLPALGSGYERITPARPHRPVVPAGASGELRLDATEAAVIPEYPY